MTKQERLDGNELIARYIGKSFHLGHISDYKEKLPESMNKRWLKYHRSFDELIPAVKKVVKDLQDNAHKDVVYGRIGGMLAAISHTILELQIEPLWSATVEAIKVINSIKEGQDGTIG